jgi:hypothetical protein
MFARLESRQCLVREMPPALTSRRLPDAFDRFFTLYWRARLLEINPDDSSKI